MGLFRVDLFFFSVHFHTIYNGSYVRKRLVSPRGSNSHYGLSQVPVEFTALQSVTF